MVTTIQFTAIVLSIIALIIAIWWLAVSWKYSSFLNDYKYARGSNASAAGQTMNLVCGAGKQICVYRATQLCSNPDSNNFENPSTDPISSGLKLNGSKYGEFDPDTTVDYTSTLGKACNGQNTCSFTFNPLAWSNSMTCSSGNTQLTSAYSCVSDSSECQSYTSSS